jgi:hypothetical protein
VSEVKRTPGNSASLATPGPWTGDPRVPPGDHYHAVSTCPIRRGKVLCCLSDGYHTHLLLSEIRGIRDEGPYKTVAIIAGGEVWIASPFPAMAEMWAEYLDGR